MGVYEDIAKECVQNMGFSRLKSFWYGQLSGMVEPVAGVIGAAAVILIKPVFAVGSGVATPGTLGAASSMSAWRGAVGVSPATCSA